MADTSDGDCCKDPNFAVVCSFLERYNDILGLPEIHYSDLQLYIEDTKSIHPALVEILLKLVRKTGRSHANPDNFERHLVRFCQSYFCDMDAWEVETVGYRHAKISTKLKILKTLLEAQFDKNFKFKEKINDFKPDELRISPLGRDKDGLAYWYFMDNDANLYIYREEQDDIDGETWELVCRVITYGLDQKIEEVIERSCDQLKTLISDLQLTPEDGKENKDETSESDENLKTDQKKEPVKEEEEDVNIDDKNVTADVTNVDESKAICNVDCKVKIEKICLKLQNGLLQEKLKEENDQNSSCRENGIDAKDSDNNVNDTESNSEKLNLVTVKKESDLKKEIDSDCSEMIGGISDKNKDIISVDEEVLNNDCVNNSETNRDQTYVNSHLKGVSENTSQNKSQGSVSSCVENGKLAGNFNSCDKRLIDMDEKHQNSDSPERNESESHLSVNKQGVEIKQEPLEQTTESKDKKSDPRINESGSVITESKPTISETDPTCNETGLTVNETEPTVNEKDPTVNEKDPTVNEKDPTVNEKGSEVDESKSTVSEKGSVTNESQPAVNETEDVVNESEPSVVNESKTPTVNKSRSVINESVHTIDESDSVIKESEPVVNESEPPTMKESDSVIKESEPVVNESEPPTSKESESVIKESESVVNESESKVNKSKPTDNSGDSTIKSQAIKEKSSISDETEIECSKTEKCKPLVNSNDGEDELAKPTKDESEGTIVRKSLRSRVQKNVKEIDETDTVENHCDEISEKQSVSTRQLKNDKKAEATEDDANQCDESAEGKCPKSSNQKSSTVLSADNCKDKCDSGNKNTVEVNDEIRTRPTRSLRKRPDPKPISIEPTKGSKQSKNDSGKCDNDSKKTKTEPSKNNKSEPAKNNLKNNEKSTENFREKQNKAKKRHLIEDNAEETSDTTNLEPEEKRLRSTRSSTRIKIRQMVEIQQALMACKSSDESDDIPLSKLKKTLKSKHPQISKVKGKNSGRGTPSAEESPGTPQSLKKGDRSKKRKKIMMDHDEDFRPGKQHKNKKKGKKKHVEEDSSDLFELEIESDESGYEVGKIGRLQFPVEKKKKGYTEIDFDDVSSISSNSNSDDTDYEPHGRNARRAAAMKDRAKEEESSEEDPEDDTPCCKCLKSNQPELILLCDKCDAGFHTACLRPPLMIIPSGDWFCPPCEHKMLLEKLIEKLSLFEAQMKKKTRLKQRKERLAYVGVSLDNILKDERKAKAKHSEEDNSSVASSGSAYRRVYTKRSCRTRTTTNYNFEEFDELIDSAIKDEVEATQGGGGLGRGKDMANIYEADDKYADRPSPVSKPKKKKKKSFKDLDAGSESDDSDSYRATDDTVSEATQPDEDNEVEEFSEEEWHPRYGFATRRSSRNRRGSSRYDDDFVVDEDESEDSDSKRRSNRSRPKRISYREVGSDESTAESTPSSDSEGYRPSRSKNKKTRSKKTKRSRRRYDSDSEIEIETKRSRVKKYHKYEDDSDYGAASRGRYEVSPPRRKRASAAKVNFKNMLASESEPEDGKEDVKDSDYSQTESEEEVVSKKRNVIRDSEDSEENSDEDSEKTENEEDRPVKTSRKRVIEDSDSDEDTVHEDADASTESEEERKEESSKRDVGKKMKKQIDDSSYETDDSDAQSELKGSSDADNDETKECNIKIHRSERPEVSVKVAVIQKKGDVEKSKDTKIVEMEERKLLHQNKNSKYEEDEEEKEEDRTVSDEKRGNVRTAEYNSSEEVLKSPIRSDDEKSASKLKQFNGVMDEHESPSKLKSEDRIIKSPPHSNMQSPNRTPQQQGTSPNYNPQAAQNADFYQNTCPPYSQGYYQQFQQSGQFSPGSGKFMPQNYPQYSPQSMYPQGNPGGPYPPLPGNPHGQHPPYPPRGPGGPFPPHNQRGFSPRNMGEGFHPRNSNMPFPPGGPRGPFMPRGTGEMFNPRGPNVSSASRGPEEGGYPPKDPEGFSHSRRPFPPNEQGRRTSVPQRNSSSVQGQGSNFGAQLSPNDSPNTTQESTSQSGRGSFMMSNILRSSKTDEPEDAEVSDIVKYVMQDDYFKD